MRNMIIEVQTDLVEVKVQIDVVEVDLVEVEVIEDLLEKEAHWHLQYLDMLQ